MGKPITVTGSNMVSIIALMTGQDEDEVMLDALLVDWPGLAADLKRHAARNGDMSLPTAPAPTLPGMPGRTPDGPAYKKYRNADLPPRTLHRIAERRAIVRVGDVWQRWQYKKKAWGSATVVDVSDPYRALLKHTDGRFGSVRYDFFAAGTLRGQGGKWKPAKKEEEGHDGS